MGLFSYGSWNLCVQVPVLWSEKYRPTMDTFVVGPQFVQLHKFSTEFGEDDPQVCVPHPSSPRSLDCVPASHTRGTARDRSVFDDPIPLCRSLMTFRCFVFCGRA